MYQTSVFHMGRMDVAVLNWWLIIMTFNFLQVRKKPLGDELEFLRWVVSTYCVLFESDSPFLETYFSQILFLSSGKAIFVPLSPLSLRLWMTCYANNFCFSSVSVKARERRHIKKAHTKIDYCLGRSIFYRENTLSRSYKTYFFVFFFRC